MTAEHEPPETPRTVAEESSHDGALPFLVVGVGASAGGLEAFIEMIETLPPDPGICFLFVQHLQPSHKSQLAEIISRITPLSVKEAEDGAKIAPDSVFIIPPNKSLALTDGHLRLTPRLPRVPNMPADHLFRSLANVQGSKAIGVILSGGGTDGTLGFQSIKAEGGITFAQDEKSAKQDSMPRSAISDGCVDHILPPPKIAWELLRLAKHSYTTRPTPHGAADQLEKGEALAQIITLLRTKTDVDFTNYKRTTIKRRINRRMALRGVEHVEEYIELLRTDPDELHNLFHDFLIRVTQFFRDPEAFEALKEKVFPMIVGGHSADLPIRIWVAGCATGEEVYSIAICLLEYLSTVTEHVPIKILATDINEAALEKARAGVYIDNIEIDVSAERLRRFFIRVNGHYQISKNIRDLCVFSRHNMASDPPFSHLDFVSCRNVLIYMDNALQKRVVPILHYSLNPSGILFLGSSESIGQHAELFNTLDSRHRIFQKKTAAGAMPLDFSAYVSHQGASLRAGREEAGTLWSALDVQREADRIVLSRFAPVGVIIDEAMTVLQFLGRTLAYLEPAPGMASLDFLRMLREGLLAEVRSAINQARTGNTPVVSRPVTLQDRTGPRQVQVEVIPFKVPPAGVRFYLILFTDLADEEKRPTERLPEQPAAPSEQQAAQLQQELGALREYLQSVIEEQESTNEELKSANEEILSANEELQSTNEELQTAKEEAQSANEELATVNEELSHRNAELARVNNDLVNLLSGVSIPIIMVSRDLRLRRFTPVAEKMFNLIPTDMGRPISDIKPNLRLDDIATLISTVIDSLTPHESEVQDREGHWFLFRIRPYVTLDNKIDGASIVLLDIDSIKRGITRPVGKPTTDDAAEKGAPAE